MLKKKKRGYKKEKVLEESKSNIVAKDINESGSDNLTRAISEVVEGLYYISETDAEILPFAGKTAEIVTKEEVLKQTENIADSKVEERSFSEFFERLTRTQDWFGEEEMATVKKFADLKSLLENNLRELKVYKIGSIQLDIYVVGLEASGILMGIKTKAVET